MSEPIDLKRLEELKFLKRAGGLGAPEKLELQELQLRQRELRLAKQRQSLNAAKRKADNALKFRIGGHAVRAGIHTWDDAQILGMMIRCKEMADNDPKLLSDWQTVGGKLINDGRETRERGAQGSGVEILVRFPAKPNDDRVMKALRGYGLRWDAHGTSWMGSVAPSDVAAIERFVADHGGTTEAGGRRSNPLVGSETQQEFRG